MRVRLVRRRVITFSTIVDVIKDILGASSLFPIRVP